MEWQANKKGTLIPGPYKRKKLFWTKFIHKLDKIRG